MNNIIHDYTLKILLSIIILIVIIFLPCVGQSAQITLTWQKPSDSRVRGYNIYYGISGTHYTAIPARTINSADQTSCLILNLEEGRSYGFTATSFDSGGNESGFSETINYRVPANPIDNDRDGYTASHGDCNDNDASIHPGAIEICNDGIDQNCDGIDCYKEYFEAIDSEPNGLPEFEAIDDDGDGFSESEGDCNDNDATICPGTIEICGDGIDQNCDGKDLECIPEKEKSGVVFEVGEVEINHEWQFVPFNKTFVNPVVVAKPMSLNGGQPAVIRIKNVTLNGFEIRIQEWEYLDGWHLHEAVGYMVMEAGRYELPGGINVEAGTFEVKHRETVRFGKIFNRIPVVISGVTTENDFGTVTSRISKVSLYKFDIELQKQENNKYNHKASEALSYIAWEPSSGEVDGMNYIVDSTFNEVTHKLTNIGFYPVFDSVPVFVADIQTSNGGNTANVRWQHKDANGVEVQIDEERSMDFEVEHIFEVIGYMVFGAAR